MEIWIILLFCWRLTDAFVTIPEPSGPFNVGYSTMELTDPTRIDHYAPYSRARGVMISAFYPVLKDQCKQICPMNYMPPATAAFIDTEYASFGVPNGTFEQLRLPMCCSHSFVEDYREYPIVLFSPGLGNSRLMYSAIAQSIASSGYFVITIDHPYDAEVVEFPDGSLIFSANFSVNSTTLALAIDTRAHDASFVLSQLSNASVVSQLVPGAKEGLDVRAAAMFGHSLGGAATLATMELDHRFKGGANLDGAFSGVDTDKTIDRPFLIFGNKIHNRTGDESWANIWPKLKGWKLELTLKKSGHGTFSDLPLLAKVLGLTPYLPPAVFELIGTLDGSRVLHIIVTYVTTLVEFVLFGKHSELLQRANARFPEILFNSSEPSIPLLRSNRFPANYDY